jgi:hypothetical protein
MLWINEDSGGSATQNNAVLQWRQGRSLTGRKVAHAPLKLFCGVIYLAEIS